MAGILEKIFETDTPAFANCTTHAEQEYKYYQRLEQNLEREQWEDAITVVYFMLLQVDPVAKACVPAGEEMILDATEYAPTFEAPLRIIYNVIYRLGEIYQNFYLINDNFRTLFLTDHYHAAAEMPQSQSAWEDEYAKYRAAIRNLG